MTAVRRMFDVVTETWNPITGCRHNCVYCWARRLAETKLKNCPRYREGFVPRLNEREFRRKFGGGVVFVSDMGDLFGEFVPDEWIERVLEHVVKFPNTKFLFLTKNPARYGEFEFPENTILGATVETDLSRFDVPSPFESYAEISSAPPPKKRIREMAKLDWDAKFLSIEPVLDFSPEFPKLIEKANPSIIYVGYDNYSCQLPEPPLDKTLRLIGRLKDLGFSVFEKTIRKAWYE